jgi:hypothetical protein
MTTDEEKEIPASVSSSIYQHPPDSMEWVVHQNLPAWVVCWEMQKNDLIDLLMLIGSYGGGS